MATLFVDHLTVIDFSYLDSKRGVVGESWIVDIELTGHLDKQGMVLDFGDVKQQIKQYIDAEIDHRLLIPTAVSGCSVEKTHDAVSITFPLSSGARIFHQSPADAIMLIDAPNIDQKPIALDLQTRVKKILPANIANVVISLRSEDIDHAYYHYTHGLQYHLGQCQRIAHGHRSRIEISLNGDRSTEAEAHWSQRLNDSYIATDYHICGHFLCNGIAHTKLAYQAQQGKFFISLPSDMIFFMPLESTVENIAGYLAEIIANEQQSDVIVKAYEGIDKGAIGQAIWNPDQA